jgi:hypothetical protein
MVIMIFFQLCLVIYFYKKVVRILRLVFDYGNVFLQHAVNPSFVGFFTTEHIDELKNFDTQISRILAEKIDSLMDNDFYFYNEKGVHPWSRPVEYYLYDNWYYADHPRNDMYRKVMPWHLKLDEFDR